MAKPRKPKHNRLNKPEESGDRAAEGEGEGVAVGTEEEGGGGKQGDESKEPPPPPQKSRPTGGGT